MEGGLRVLNFIVVHNNRNIFNSNQLENYIHADNKINYF